MIDLVRIFLKDKDKKSVPQMARELWSLTRSKKELPSHYLGKHLYRKQIENPQDYLSMGEFYKVLNSKNLHKAQYRTLLRNKLIFSLYCNHYGLATPQLVSHNLDQTFVFNGSKDRLTTPEKVKTFFNMVIKKSGNYGLFVKAAGDMGGKDCFLLKKDGLDEQLNTIAPILLKGAFLHQKVVRQHEVIARIYPGSLNTLRLDTYIDTQGKAHVLSGLMRFGSGGGFVDNASSGGLQVGVNLENGTLKERAYSQMKQNRPFLYAHPDTDVAFKDSVIPFFKEACELVLRAVDHIPDRLIGWDVAISPEGPMLIEGNDNPSIHITDIAYQGYHRHPLFQEIMREA